MEHETTQATLLYMESLANFPYRKGDGIAIHNVNPILCKVILDNMTHIHIKKMSIKWGKHVALCGGSRFSPRGAPPRGACGTNTVELPTWYKSPKGLHVKI